MNRAFLSASWTRPWRALLQCLLALFAISLSGAAVAIPSTVTVASTANPSTSGQAVTLTATITCGIPPTGTASFFDGVVLLGVVPLSGGAAAFSTAAFTVGSHLITVIYNGDINCDPSAGGLTQDVNAVIAPAAIPTLGTWAQVLLAVMLAGLALRSRGRREKHL